MVITVALFSIEVPDSYGSRQLSFLATYYNSLPFLLLLVRVFCSSCVCSAPLVCVLLLLCVFRSSCLCGTYVPYTRFQFLLYVLELVCVLCSSCMFSAFVCVLIRMCVLLLLFGFFSSCRFPVSHVCFMLLLCVSSTILFVLLLSCVFCSSCMFPVTFVCFLFLLYVSCSSCVCLCPVPLVTLSVS